MKRVDEIDFLKGVLILLVIGFHLVWFEQLHPAMKQVVYSFHMPGFLFVSGYLMNVGKGLKAFGRTLLWLAVPYLVMESGYIVMASLLPINEHIERLTPTVFLDRLLLHPLGPYWYLHCLILCGTLYFFIFNRLRRGLTTRFLLIFAAYYAVARGLGILSFSSALYFLAGASLRQNGGDFVSFFCPSWRSVAAFVLLVVFAESPTQASLVGALIAWTAVSSLLFLYRFLPSRAKTTGFFLGRNSLPLYVFSPVFTVLTKRFVPYLAFDGTGILFLLVSLAFCVGGSLLVAWMTDLTGTSRYLFGRRALTT